MECNNAQHNWPILTRDQARDLDRRAIEDLGIPSILLMESARRGIAEFILSHHVRGKIWIFCGKGNNGGDDFVVARYLNNCNLTVHILLCANPAELRGDAKTNYEIALKMLLPITIVNDKNLDALITETTSGTDWIIDALLDTGLRGYITSFYQKVIQVINKSHAKIVSIDIPSGLDCNTGRPLGIAVKANYTLTIACYKTGFTQLEAKEFLGEIQVVDIGIRKIYERNLP